jgi:hypothetical protein
MSYVGKAAGLVLYEGTGVQHDGTLYAFLDDLIIAWRKRPRDRPTPTLTVPGRLSDFVTECQLVPEDISSYTSLLPPPEIASAVLRTRTLTAFFFGWARVDLVARSGRPRKMSFRVSVNATGELADLLAATLNDRFEQRPRS